MTISSDKLGHFLGNVIDKLHHELQLNETLQIVVNETQKLLGCR